MGRTRGYAPTDLQIPISIHSPSKLEGVPRRGGGVCPFRSPFSVHCRQDACAPFSHLWYPCAESADVFHIGTAFNGVAFGREVVEEVDEHCLLRAGDDGRAPLTLSVVGEDDVDDALYFILRNFAAFEFALQRDGGDVDVAEQYVFALGLTVAAVGVDFAVVVEEDGEDAMVYAYGIWHTGSDALQHREHLVDVVEESAAESVVDAAGRGVLRVGLVELCGDVADHIAVGAVGTEGEECGDGLVPELALYGARQEGIEGMTGVGHCEGPHIALAGRALAVIVLYVDEGDELSNKGWVVGSDFPYGEGELFVEVFDFEVAIG